jgi:hypothetical protein
LFVIGLDKFDLAVVRGVEHFEMFSLFKKRLTSG